MLRLLLLCFTALIAPIYACSSCYGPNGANPYIHKRLVRRMQPGSLEAEVKPKGPLEWGQVNFIQTTDTHGWLAGHLKEKNYGADWGDFVSFVKHMRQKADDLNVDLLLIDTGDLHDGAGLSDATNPNGLINNDIFSNLEYDLLSIGNHELYVTDVAYETFANFSKVYGERYLTSNVQIINKTTGEYQDIGHRYRYFTTKRGLRIMSFGVLFDFTGNSNVSKITKAEDMVKEKWFIDAVNYPEPIDLFVVIGHNPVRRSDQFSTFGTLYSAIREMRPDVPIQGFGGHTHIRDFAVYDEMSTAIEAGRYCETVGWLSLTGIQSPTFTGTMAPAGEIHPSRKAIPPASDSEPKKRTLLTTPAKLDMRYARRYLDWNRLTFAYHAVGSQDHTYDTEEGKQITSDITDARQELDLIKVHACVPRTYCVSCKPFDTDGNVYYMVKKMFEEIVVNGDRADKPRVIFSNTGGVRFDLVQGPLTMNDVYALFPFKNAFQYIPDVPFSQARQVLDIMNAGPHQKRSMGQYDRMDANVCVDPPYDASFDGGNAAIQSRSMVHRDVEETDITPGYVTHDDFGDDGDDTPHSSIPYYDQPNDLQVVAGFPADGSDPETVDVVFVDFIGARWVVPALNQAGGKYTKDDIKFYLPEEYKMPEVLLDYGTKHWQDGMPNCPVGEGVGGG